MNAKYFHSFAFVMLKTVFTFMNLFSSHLGVVVDGMHICCQWCLGKYRTI